MEFWGVEVKAGEPVKTIPALYKVIHVSQAALGEAKGGKGAISVPLRLKIGNKDYVIGNLSNEDRPQLMLDLIFEKEFELSHDWKHGSVYFFGYMSDDPCGLDEDDSDEEYSSDEEGDQINGIQGKLKPMVEEDSEIDSDEAGDCDASDDDSTDGSLENGSGPLGMDDSDASDEDYSSDDTPAKGQVTKKRTLESAADIPAPAKKAKLLNEKKGGKNGQPGKAPSTGNKSKGQTPKSGANGNVSGKPTNKPFSKKAKQGGK